MAHNNGNQWFGQGAFKPHETKAREHSSRAPTHRPLAFCVLRILRLVFHSRLLVMRARHMAYVGNFPSLRHGVLSIYQELLEGKERQPVLYRIKIRLDRAFFHAPVPDPEMYTSAYEDKVADSLTQTAHRAASVPSVDTLLRARPDGMEGYRQSCRAG